MDNVTHALAGALLAAACRRVASTGTTDGGQASAQSGNSPAPSATRVRTFRRTAFTLGVVLAELPDIDITYSGDSLGIGPLGYLLHHRGHTHTVLFTVLAGFAAWGVVLLLRRDLRAPPLARTMLALALAASLSHIALDYTNNYGVHPWWPFDGRWIYGDAVFIVEPWLWIAALPPLAFIARRWAWRAVCGFLLLAILVASWRVEIVGRDVAAIVTAGALLWTLAMWKMRPELRATAAIVAWLALETTFFTSSAAARRVLTNAVGAPLRDAVLTPAPGNPLCLSTIAVTADNGTYSATTATVAPFPALRSAVRCGNTGRGTVDGSSPSERRDTPSIHWGLQWSAPVAELRALAAERCEMGAALKFIRVPIWRRSPAGDVTISDLRFGTGGDSFTTVVSRPGASCPRWVPGWREPRIDLLQEQAP